MNRKQLVEQAEEAYILAIREGVNLPEMDETEKVQWYEEQMGYTPSDDEIAF